MYMYIYAQLLASDIIAIQVSHVTYMRSRDRYMVSHDRPTQSDGRGREEEEEPGAEGNDKRSFCRTSHRIYYISSPDHDYPNLAWNMYQHASCFPFIIPPICIL